MRGKGPVTEPPAKDAWFEEVGKKTVELARGVRRSILCCLGEALRICSRSLAFVLPPIVGVNRFIYWRKQALHKLALFVRLPVKI